MRASARKMETDEAASNSKKIASLYLCTASFRSTLDFSQSAQDAFGCQWEFAEPDTGGVMHCCSDGRRDGEKREFAQAACPERPVRVGYFQNNRFDGIRDIQNGWNEIGTELVGQDVTVTGD